MEHHVWSFLSPMRPKRASMARSSHTGCFFLLARALANSATTATPRRRKKPPMGRNATGK